MSGRLVKFNVIDLPCTAKVEHGCWQVTVAEISFATSHDLASAISAATGGIVSTDDVRILAHRLERQAGHAHAGRRVSQSRPLAV
jgi:hypothetical protein